MSSKPKPRPLSAEPLEERLLVSSSAAGVLFGLGLANDTTTAAYESPQTTPVSAAQQPALVDLTFDLQLDALAVDLVHSEESLLDTISAASEDPFVLTPLTPGVALSDADNDAHRELGDELLLYQISTLDFTEVAFEPVTPHRGFARQDFCDALKPLEDLTAYGYSPVANDLKDNGGINGGGGSQMSCGCGPYVSTACLKGPFHGTTTSCGCVSGSCSAVNAAAGYISPGVYNYYPASKTIYVFQDNDTTTITAYMSWVGAGAGSGCIEITTEGYENYWTNVTTSSTSTGLSMDFTWTKPGSVSNASALRDFEFTFTVSGGNTVALFVHIGYAELQVQFAGEGGYKPLKVKGDKTDQTASNTVVIGQHVEAEFLYDSVFVPVLNSYNQFSTPTGGSFVKDYITNDAIGLVIEHDQNDYICTYFDYYYTSKAANTNTGSISCSGLALKDPNGITHLNLTASASFYIEAPTVDSFSSVFASWNPAENPVGVRPSKIKDPNDETPCLILGGTPEGKDTEAGITWTANVSPPPVIGGGKIAFNQQVQTSISCYYYLFSNEALPILKSQSEGIGVMLDNKFPYDNHIVSAGNKLKSNDSPSTPLPNPLFEFDDHLYYADSYIRDDTFSTYLIYKPEGTSMIWVTLSVINWSWYGGAIYENEWKFVFGDIGGGGDGTPSSFLPQWDKNTKNYSGWIPLVVGQN